MIVQMFPSLPDDSFPKGVPMPPGFFRAIPMMAEGSSVNDAWFLLPEDTQEVMDGLLIITNRLMIPERIGGS